MVIVGQMELQGLVASTQNTEVILVPLSHPWVMKTYAKQRSISP